VSKPTTKKQSVINHFLKNPNAHPKVVSQKYAMAMPAVYALRKQAAQMSVSSATFDVQQVPVREEIEAKEMAFDHPLYPVVLDAIRQAMFGKGQRHGGNVTPFFDQPWTHYAKMHGRGFLTGQAAKKLEEAASTRDGEAFEQEVLGAIVYCGMAILMERKRNEEAK
jgi:hypothetical protein